MAEVYHADASLKGKLRRRYAKLVHRKPAGAPPGGMVTFSFDDAPASAATTGAALLEARGLRGTYYISTGLMGADSPMGVMADARQVKALHAAGHEIACHTQNHIDCGVSAADHMTAEVWANHRALEALGLPAPANFAYPYGDVSPAAKRALGGRFGALRGLHHGLVEAGSDLNQSPAVGIEGEDGEAVAVKWLAEASRRGAWLVLYTHDVQERPSPFGCTPTVLERLIDRSLALGLEVVTVAQALERLQAGRSGGLARRA